MSPENEKKLLMRFLMRSAGEAEVMISWDRPSDTGSDSRSSPLLRYNFEYFDDASHSSLSFFFAWANSSMSEGLLFVSSHANIHTHMCVCLRVGTDSFP